MGRIIADLDKLVPIVAVGMPEKVAALAVPLAPDEAARICGSPVKIIGALDVV